MKKNILFLLAVFASVQVLGQSNGNFRVVTARDSIYLAGVWVKQFSHDSTMGNGSGNILPTERAVKGALGKAGNDLKDTSLAIRNYVDEALGSVSGGNIYTEDGTLTGHRIMQQGNFALQLQSLATGTGDNRTRLYKDGSQFFVTRTAEGGLNTAISMSKSQIRVYSLDPTIGENDNGFTPGTTTFRVSKAGDPGNMSSVITEQSVVSAAAYWNTTVTDPTGLAYARMQFDNEALKISQIVGLPTIQLGNIHIITGEGDPEGVVTAPPGSLYLQNNAGAGGMWLKTSGTGNAGWIAK